MKVKHLAALVAATMVAAPSAAAGIGGARIEARLGWEQAKAKGAYHLAPADATDEPEIFSARSSKDGLSYGVELGYDALVGSSFILGAYAGLDLAKAELCGAFGEEDRGCLSRGRTFNIGLRAGIPIGDRAMVYAKGGYSNAKVELSYDSDVADEDNALFMASKTSGGFHVGGGAELSFTANTYGKLEYAYTGFDSYDHIEEDLVAAADTDRHQLLVGLGLRF